MQVGGELVGNGKDTGDSGREMNDCPHEKTRPCFAIGAGDDGYMGDICEACGEWVDPFREVYKRQVKGAEERERQKAIGREILGK